MTIQHNGVILRSMGVHGIREPLLEAVRPAQAARPVPAPAAKAAAKAAPVPPVAATMEEDDYSSFLSQKRKTILMTSIP